MYPEVSKCFSGQRRILFVQGYMVLLEATLRDPNFRPAGQGQFAAILAASQACATAVQAVFGVQSPILRLPVCRAGLTFNPDKKLQIAYMPRRRRVEVKVMERLIAGHPDLAHIPLVPIDEVSEDEAHHILRESLIFLSFSEKEGFGLPPAEAMATGCLVVGYTGVGGEEYFTAETGFPVPDGDLARFVETLVGVVRSWRQDRRALEDRRRHASDHIWQCYTEEIALGSLRGLWAEIDAKM
jgi:glycosyltransferase involved in cell wall biosynthesis